jgi:hypothetical protein
LFDPSAGSLLPAVSSQRLQHAYIFESNDYVRIRNAISEGHLVPLEAVWLTNRSSFADSQAEGQKNMRSRAEFNSMLDVRRARDVGVTPLPLLERAK